MLSCCLMYRSYTAPRPSVHTRRTPRGRRYVRTGTGQKLTRLSSGNLAPFDHHNEACWLVYTSTGSSSCEPHLHTRGQYLQPKRHPQSSDPPQKGKKTHMDVDEMAPSRSPPSSPSSRRPVKMTKVEEALDLEEATTATTTETSSVVIRAVSSQRMARGMTDPAGTGPTPKPGDMTASFGELPHLSGHAVIAYRQSVGVGRSALAGDSADPAHR